jgi:hypothetical protein
VGLINPPLASTAIDVVHHSRSGMASGINNTFRQVGIATGIAGLGAVFQHEVTRNTSSALLASSAGREVLGAAHGKLSGALVSGNVGALARSLSPAARTALNHSYRVASRGLHEHPDDRRRDRVRRLHAGVRAGARPRLRGLCANGRGA